LHGPVYMWIQINHLKLKFIMKLRYFKKLLIIIFILSALGFSVRAQMFAGYDQFCGVPVIVVPNPQIASAARDQNGYPVIYIDPSAMSNWSHSRIFTLAHECGHHSLGHSTPQGMWFRNTQIWATRAQELQADCWAAQALMSIWAVGDLVRVVNYYAAQGNYSPGGYPSGQERAINIRRCAGI